MHCTDASRCGASGFRKWERSGICTPYLWVQTQSVCANDPMPPDNQRCTLIQSRWANWVESRAGICWSFILFHAISLFHSFSLFRSLSLSQYSCRPALRAAKPSRENAISTLADRNQKARQRFLTLTEAIGSHMRGCSHVISAVFVNGNP